MRGTGHALLDIMSILICIVVVVVVVVVVIEGTR